MSGITRYVTILIGVSISNPAFCTLSVLSSGEGQRLSMLSDTGGEFAGGGVQPFGTLLG